MRKLLALIMAASMVLSLALSVSAVEIVTVEQFVEVDISASTEFYNPNDTVYVSFTLENITLDDGDGLSAFELELYFDSEMVTSAFQPAVDGDGDNCDFSSLLTANPNDAWECFGSLDSDNSRFLLGFADFAAQSLVAEDDIISFKMPFKVKSTARVEDIVFSLKNFSAYNGDLSKSCSVSVDDVVIQYALQPNTLVTLPTDAVRLDIAGYKHAVNNVIFYSENSITVSDYINKYMTPAAGQDKMESFVVLIADANGRIIDMALDTRDKSAMTIPAGCYLIGVHSDKASALDVFTDKLSIGSTITLYNINVEATGRNSTPKALTNAGFTISSFALKDDADAYFNPDDMTVIVYEDDLTLDEFKDMFEGNISVVDANGNAVADDDTVTTGMIIDHESGVTVIVLGDCNCDGIVDQFDYLMLKAHVMVGFELSEAGYKAVCITDTYPSQFDYLVVKSYCFGMIDMSQFKPAV